MNNLYDTRRYLTNFEVSRVGHLLTDVLVVGGGVGGARAAIESAAYGDVILIAKQGAEDSNTLRAQGGIAVCDAPGDSWQQHLEDTVRVGCGLVSPRAAETMVRAGPARAKELVDWGAQFDKAGGSWARTREGGHGVSRILRAQGDSTGREIGRVLLGKLRSLSNVRFFEQCFLIDLITVDGRCVGAVTHHQRYGHQMIWARQTILASGGCGQIFRESTNSPIATGDGLAAAYRAGAMLADVEMVQFHPTTLYIAGSTRALISEAARGEGAYLVDRDGHRFMLEYHPDGELAPRDVVSRAIRDRLLQTGGTSVYLDVRHIGRQRFGERFPFITRQCAEFGIDVGSDLIPVNPGAHYMIGGVATDLEARTNVPGLFACGEAACTGVHGANRLASNSLLEGLVFGAIAGRTAGRSLDIGPQIGPSSGVRSQNPPSPRTTLDLVDVRNSLRSVMWRNAGIARSGDRLRETVEIIDFWGRFVLDKTFDDAAGWETQNKLSLARLMAQAAELRTESLGVHYRVDAPPDAGQVPPTHLTVTRSDDGPVFERCPVELSPAE
ncbi:MAG TPA: L-aspartate oxidase [Phycisphaerae bacterium]|nr:L-aspartate oxidase [Phycisphaerae bacterium]